MKASSCGGKHKKKNPQDKKGKGSGDFPPPAIQVISLPLSWALLLSQDIPKN